MLNKQKLMFSLEDLKPYCLKPIKIDLFFYKREIACCECKGCKSRLHQLYKEAKYEKKKTKKISFFSS